MKEKSKIIMDLEKDFLQYDSVLLCIPNDEDSVLQSFCESGAYMRNGTKLKLYVPSSFGIDFKGNVRVLSEQELNNILEYYRMYEFSNRLKVVEDNKQFGGLVNYLKNGILTEEEFFEAILS